MTASVLFESYKSSKKLKTLFKIYYQNDVRIENNKPH